MIMIRRLACAVVSIAVLGMLPACAVEEEEEIDSSDQALAADWAEYDEDATPIPQDDKANALGDDEGDVELAAAVEPDETDEPGAAISAPPPLPKGCVPNASLDLVVYTEGYSVPMLKALSENAGPCSRYTVSVPKVAASAKNPNSMLFPRKVKGKGVRQYGAGFVASAEVHWGGVRDKATGKRYPGWKNVKVVKLGPAKYETRVVPQPEIYDNDWFWKGVLFRQRMAKAGFRPQAGDTWHINELESMWTRSRLAQKAIRDLVRGLATGDQEYDAAKDADPEIAKLTAAEKDEITKAARMKDVKGIVFIAALGKRRPGETTSAGVKNDLKQTLRRKRFWSDMNKYVASWGLERYLAYGGHCKGDGIAAQDRAMAEEIMELHLVAARVPRYKSGPNKGESPVGTALSYLSRAYQPLINAAWGFHNDARTLPQMGSFVRAQVHATRAFAEEHRTPDNRIGIYWNVKDGASAAQSLDYARRVANSLEGAYDGKDGNPIGACGEDGVGACTCGD
jgi:hypothetical protein